MTNNQEKYNHLNLLKNKNYVLKEKITFKPKKKKKKKKRKEEEKQNKHCHALGQTRKKERSNLQCPVESKREQK